MLDISAQVLDNDDRGLLGIAVDPDYVNNHFVYLMHTVDPDSNGVDDNDDAFGRLARYQVSATDSETVVPGSRTILLGVTWRQGPPSGSLSHTIGSLRWGADGSLLVSAGEGAQFDYMDSGGHDPGMFGPQKTNPVDDIGAFRAQDVGSLGGKILRIDPATGQGYPTNPFYNGDPTSVRSRVWAYGLRNPFRFTRWPDTGDPDPATGRPGTLVIGDVGWSSWEEIDVAPDSARNFGWPCREGFYEPDDYGTAHPARLGCDSVGTFSDPVQPTHPILSWSHYDAALSFPPTVLGQCVSAVGFYTGSAYPPQYRHQLFIGDYGSDWIKVLRLDGAGRPLELLDFADATDFPVDFATEPGTGNLVYVAIAAPDVRRIRYTGGSGNGAPTAIADATPASGATPLGIQFSAAASVDPDGDPLTYAWTFGDGGNANVRDPQHSYLTAGPFDAILTVDDGHGNFGSDTVHVTAVSPPSFPRTHALDTFDGGDGQLVAPWSDPDHGLRRAQIVNGALVPGCCATLAPVWTATAFGPDQEAWITFSRVTAGAREHDLMMKMQDKRDDADHVEVRYDALLGQVQVSTLTGSTWTTRGAPIDAHFQAGDVFGARATAAGQVQVYRNSVVLGSVSLASWPSAGAGGYIGLSFEGAYRTRVEDFGGGNVGTLAVPEPASAGLALSAPRPNPSSHGATLDLTLPVAASVAFDVLDVQGRLLWHAADARLDPGVHRLAWSGTDAAGRMARAGIVLARVRVDGRTLVRPIAVVR